ncbi:hypothetical protein ACIHCX_03105 [Streptomyces sp. NPDC052043]|uniref:hypothetical protein n=1 Tax=Streptomyces sp. NPDC052043 TaxID=3365684 RepID=UPI0037D6D02B
MTTAIPLGTTGKHSPAYVDLRAYTRQVEDDNRQLSTANEQQAGELHTALVRGCQDAMYIARLECEHVALLAANENLRHATIRAKAEQERLRRAVVNARPRIREVPTDLVRPYSPVVELPYVAPVPHRDTSNETTQQLPILDQPAAPWPTYRVRTA